MKEFWQKLLRKLKKPKGWLLAFTYFFTAIFCAAAISIAVLGPETTVLEILSYAFYGLAAVSLGYSVYSIVLYAPTMKQSVTEWIKKFSFGRRMLEKYGFRTIVFAACSLSLNIAYVAFHIVLAFLTDSFFWYCSLALYYGLLVALRSGIVLYHRKKRKWDEKEQKRIELAKYHTCGVMLTLIPLCLVIPLLQIFFLDKAFAHEGWSVIAFAAYAFYKITMAIYNAVKAGKQEDITVRALRSVGLADALFSIFSLQTALLYAFSEGQNYSAINMATGIAVFALTVAIGVGMLVKFGKMKKEWIEEE